MASSKLPGSEVTMSYRLPPEDWEPDATASYNLTIPQNTGRENEPQITHNTPAELEEILKRAGFVEVIHHRPEDVTARLYPQPEAGKRYMTMEGITTAVVG